jgi:hypothetical protein
MAKWMQKAAEEMKEKGTVGSFSRAAKKAGESTQSFAREKASAQGKMGKKARFALAASKARH